MNNLFKNILIVMGIIILLCLIQLIFVFLNISFDDYSTYLFWFISLVIFYYILPSAYPIAWGT